MERNGEENAAQEIERSVPAEERTGRPDYYKWLTDDSQILIAECQAEGQNLIQILH